jgi:hypothetical protein
MFYGTIREYSTEAYESYKHCAPTERGSNA